MIKISLFARFMYWNTNFARKQLPTFRIKTVLIKPVLFYFALNNSVYIVTLNIVGYNEIHVD